MKKNHVVIILLSLIVIFLVFLIILQPQNETFQNPVSNIIDYLKVYSHDNKIRYGEKGDGGYVVGKLDGDYDCYISAGVSTEESFSRDFISAHNNLDKSNCFAFDGTIDDYPYSYTRDITYYKKNIGPNNDNNHTNLSDILSKYSNIFIKMDIEGHEYPWIQSLQDDHLNNIKQMVIEFHGINDDSWNFPKSMKEECVKKLTKFHHIVHVHGNNNSAHTNKVPDVLEVTYVHKKNWVNQPPLNSSALPITNLDFPNKDGVPDFDLNIYPFVFPDSGESAEGFQSAGTLLQLETSHVPTRAEAKREHRWLRRRIHQDLMDLTGSA